MTVNEYCSFLLKDGVRIGKSCVLVVPRWQDQQDIRAFYRQRPDVSILPVSDAIITNAFLPMPAVVFSRIKDSVRAVNAKGKVACVVGLDGYMRLVSPDKHFEIQAELRTILDDASLKVSFIVGALEMKKEFPLSYPRYREEQSILEIGRGSPDIGWPQEITFVHKQLPPPEMVVAPSIQCFLKDVEDGKSFSHVCICVDSIYTEIPGVDPSVRQVLTLKSYFKEFCDFDENISDSGLQWLYDRMCQSEVPGSVLHILQTYFYPVGLKDCLVTAPKRIRQAAGAERELLIWMLKKTVARETYLALVLSNENMNRVDFTEVYVSAALDILNSPKALDYAAERQKALKEISCGHLVHATKSFITQCKEYPTGHVALWLNNGTDDEKREIMRRTIADQGVDVPLVSRASYPLLDAYLQEYRLGFEVLNEYFSFYRTQKIKNSVSSEFHARAFQEELPPDLPNRDALVQKYVSDAKTGLLVVDALSAEYVPMILALAQMRGTGVKDMSVAYCRLPSSTRYNRIAWPDDRRIREVKQLDNVIHHGIEANAPSKIEENLTASLEVIEKNVFPAIEEGLQFYNRIILTSDHGASRLAVCAYAQGFSQTVELPKGVDILDWRFCSAHESAPCPDEMTPSFCGAYWAVKGYNRLPKQGGKQYELHGGATIEERLVPVIVFERGAVFESKPQRGACAKDTQIAVNDDFDL